MNSSTGDTVDSTKSTTTTTMTTGDEWQATKNTRTEVLKANTTRHRRHRAQDGARRLFSTLPPPEVNKLPQTGEELKSKGQRERSPGEPRLSRLGDFFSTLASRIRGNRASDFSVSFQDNKLSIIIRIIE